MAARQSPQFTDENHLGTTCSLDVTRPHIAVTAPFHQLDFALR
jgi:hypothetical protein